MLTYRKTVRLHPVQQVFRHSSALYRGFVGGVGAGKSWCGSYDLIRRARPGRTYMVVGPSYPSLHRSTIRTFLKVGRELGVIDPAHLRISPPPQLTLGNGAEVLFASADRPDTLRGPSLTGVWLDEASLMPRDVFDVSIGRLREDGEHGWLSATYTPKGPDHWTAEIFRDGRPNTAVFRARTRDNPFLPPEYEANLREQYGETLWAQQELDAALVRITGSEFPAEWFAEAPDASRPPVWFDDWPADLVLKVIALDPSKGTDSRGTDFQAIVLIGVAVEDGRYVLYVDAELLHTGVTEMVARLVALSKWFSSWGKSVGSVLVEDNGTMGLFPPVLEAECVRQSHLMPWVCRNNTQNKEYRIRFALQAPLSRRQIRFRRTASGRMLVAQVQAFPFGEHDDGPDALASGLTRVGEMLGGGR